MIMHIPTFPFLLHNKQILKHCLTLPHGATVCKWNFRQCSDIMVLVEHGHKLLGWDMNFGICVI